MNGIRLLIVLEEGKGLSITGPLDNPIIFYGMLEAAKDAFRNMQKEKESAIQPAKTMPPLLVHS